MFKGVLFVPDWGVGHYLVPWKQRCDSPITGCTNAATLVVGEYWLCPNCAGSVAVDNKIKTGWALTLEQLAALDKAKKA